MVASRTIDSEEDVQQHRPCWSDEPTDHVILLRVQARRATAGRQGRGRALASARGAASGAALIPY